MFKRIMVLLILISTPFLLFSETVLLYTITKSGDTDIEQFGDLMESGVMNEFFDAGHIIFNAAVSGDIPEVGLSHYKEAAAMQLAKAGGAAFLLEVKFVYTEVKGRDLLSTANYQLINVTTGDLVEDGSVSIDNRWIEKDEFENGVTAMGRSMASYALSFL
ncbi:MAG: hypothetical protein L3J12_03335 [Spirochaetales bacterium]|nr:hypothetical protein [Spirochaetales bacterium]